MAPACSLYALSVKTPPMGSRQPVEGAAAPHAEMCHVCRLVCKLKGHCQAVTSSHSANATCADTVVTWRSILCV